MSPRRHFVGAPAAPAQGTGVLFDYNQVLRGRRLHLDALDAFLSSTGESIAVLPGRGGIGKTKLVREWAGRQTSWNVLWASEMRPWQAGAESEIPSGDTLLVVDDAHRYGDLAQAIGLVANWRGPQKLKMVITTRPSGRDYVNERLAQFVDETRVLRCPTLKELTLEETIELAGEMPGAGFAHLAPQLAQVSQDTPLVTVVGGRLVAKGEILPDLLGNHEAFQHAVFDKFANECAGQLPAGGKSKEELLHLLAAVQPVDERAPAFDAAAPAFLGLRSDQIRRNVLALEETGIVIRTRDAARIVPDVLADYLLERASVGPNHYVTGYADAVFEAFHEGFLSNLLKNLAELDWRITQRDPQTRLLENIWSRLRETFRTRQAHGRRQMLMEMQKVVAFQPAAVHRLLQLAMDDPAETSYDYGYEVTDAKVIRVVPELLAVTIYDPESSADAFWRLWLLSKSGPEEETRNRARRVLKEAIGYQKGLSDYLLDHPQSILAQVAGIAVRLWRDIDPAPFSHYGSLLARTGGWRTAGSVADVVCGGPPLEHPIQQDVEVLAALCERTEPAVLGTVLRGLARLGKVPAFRAAAMELILRIEPGDSEYLARSLCELVGPGHLSPAMLDEPTIRGILSKLIALNELPDEALGTFLAYVGGRAPLAVAEFLEARLNHAIEIKADEGFSRYKPLPSSQFWSSFQGIQESPEYRVTLEKIFSWVRRFPRWIYETLELFWHFGKPDETTFSVLDDTLHSTGVPRSDRGASVHLRCEWTVFYGKGDWVVLARGDSIQGLVDV